MGGIAIHPFEMTGELESALDAISDPDMLGLALEAAAPPALAVVEDFELVAVADALSAAPSAPLVSQSCGYNVAM